MPAKKTTHMAPAKVFRIPPDIAALGHVGRIIIDSMRKDYVHRMNNVTKRKPIQRKKKKG